MKNNTDQNLVVQDSMFLEAPIQKLSRRRSESKFVLKLLQETINPFGFSLGLQLSNVLKEPTVKV
jgi:hypothetical protein